ncbi:MAG: hypothetical protein ACMUHX_00430 [bacterium]
MSKCVICRNRKGKRFCLEQNGMICAPCCGNRIYSKANCHQDCVYLKSSQDFKKQKDNDKGAQEDFEINIDWPVIRLMEKNIYDRLKNDIYYEDRDILLGIERKIKALEQPDIPREILLNRSGVIESVLDDMIRNIHMEEGVDFPDERILHALRSHARLVRHEGSSRKGGHRYIDILKNRIIEIEERIKKEKSKEEKGPDHPLITLPFG